MADSQQLYWLDGQLITVTPTHAWAAFIAFLCADHCGYACGYFEPFGFVPECGCPIHDVTPLTPDDEGKG